ncbi:hypothetical protein A9Q74_01135 [Colwellia sp. 39_35_sub15_T18]|nr:hypothetical protein A9Q74_01135 [Colwellia sp. 39_35_sub15_T18]
MNNIKQLMLVPLIVSSVLLYSFTSVAGEQVNETLMVKEATTVAIENVSGKVNIIGWNKASVHVEGELDDKAEKLVFEQVGSTINISVELPNHGHWNSVGSQLTIRMPASLRVNFEGVSSNVELNNLTHSVIVKTVSGDINAENLSQNIELSSVSGNIKSKALQGKINLSVVSGYIDDEGSTGRLQLQSVSGEIEAKTMANEIFINNISGNTELELAQIDELKLSTVSGDSDVSLFLQANGVVKASSVSGTVSLDFQQNIEADFRLKANAGGDLVNKLTEQKAQEAKYGPSSKLYFQTGNANGSVRVSTVSGDVIVK